jgi:hypothetical protein
MESAKIKVVYTIVERAGKSFWIRIGIGSVNQDGSLNLRLDAMPVNGTLQVRDYEPRDDRPGGELPLRRIPEGGAELQSALL